MALSWIVTASRNLLTVASDSGRPRRHRASLSLESLEQRLSLSSVVPGKVTPADLNPQPLPPGFFDRMNDM
jgi:hypothetical protein